MKIGSQFPLMPHKPFVPTMAPRTKSIRKGSDSSTCNLTSTKCRTCIKQPKLAVEPFTAGRQANRQCQRRVVGSHNLNTQLPTGIEKNWTFQVRGQRQSILAHDTQHKQLIVRAQLKQLKRSSHHVNSIVGNESPWTDHRYGHVRPALPIEAKRRANSIRSKSKANGDKFVTNQSLRHEQHIAMLNLKTTKSRRLNQHAGYPCLTKRNFDSRFGSMVVPLPPHNPNGPIVIELIIGT